MTISVTWCLKMYRLYKEKPILFNININATAGKTIGIMGATGSGKTSIINLIGRLYDVTSGRVLVDGVDVRDWKLSALRSQIGIVMQDTFLFSDTIEGNILYGNPNATREDVIRAAKIAEAHDFIMEMPEGYDTVVGERVLDCPAVKSSVLQLPGHC